MWQLSALLLHLTLYIGDIDCSGGGSLRRRQQLFLLLFALRAWPSDEVQLLRVCVEIILIEQVETVVVHDRVGA